MTIMPKVGEIVRSKHGWLSEDQLHQAAPSIFAEHAHESRSSKYQYIPTIDVVRGLMQAGYAPVEVRQGRSRIEGKEEYTKHMLRFRATNETMRVGDTYAEALLVNSHDGSSRYKLMSGLFKLLCLNGLVAEEGPFAQVMVLHRGNIIDEVVKGTKTVLNNAAKLLDVPGRWGAIELDHPTRMTFATEARKARFADAEGKIDTSVTAAQLLAPRRSEDAKRDLWTTFNVVQENCVKGGLSTPRENRWGRRVNAHTREVRGINENVKLNRTLWGLAERIAEAAA